MSNLDNYVWAEKYRPAKVDDTILPAPVKKMIKEVIADGNSPSFLFAGSSGVGKTTAARAIANELGSDLLFINASLDGNLDMLRTTITQFVSTVSFSDSKKIVLLDECLSEFETVRIGTVDDWEVVQLKDLQRDTEYPVVSYNMDTGEYENDTGYIISDREDDLFDVTLESGTIVTCNEKHPFVCVDKYNNIVQRSISDGLLGYFVVCSL